MQLFRLISIFSLFVVVLTACQTPLNQSNNDSQNTPENNPYAQFKQERASLEPIIETSSLLTPSKTKKVNPETSKVNLPKVQPLDVEGNLEIAGSTDIFTLNQSIYDRFISLGYSGLINFSTIGTNESIKFFCQQGQFDLLTLARPMKESELANCRANGIEPSNFLIGKDAIVIVVSHQNDFLSKVSMPMLSNIFTKHQWSDINPNFPEQPIERFAVNPGSSFDLVVEKVLAGNSSSLLNAPNTTLYRYEDPMIQGLSTNIYGIGFLSHSVFKKSSSSLKSLVIDGTTPKSINFAGKTYPLERSLYIYVNPKQLRQKPQLSSFINFYLTHVNEEIEDVGLFPISIEQLDKSKNQWLQMVKITN